MKYAPWFVDEHDTGVYGRHVNVRNCRGKLVVSVNAVTLGLDAALELARVIASLSIAETKKDLP